MYQSSPKSHMPSPPPSGHLTFFKIFGQIPRYVGSLDGQMHRCTGPGGGGKGGARGAAAPPKFGQLRFFGQREKIWAKPVFKDVSMFFIIIII